MSAKKIIELRNLLESEIKKAFRKSGALDTAKIVSEFKVARAAEVGNASEQLLDIALTKLVGDIRQRKRHGLLSESEQALFADIHGLRQSFIVRDSKGRKVNKTILMITIGELDDWLHAQATPISRISKNASLVKQLKFVTPFAASLDTTFLEALNNAKAGIKPSKKKA
jgi:hypothetical protein